MNNPIKAEFRVGDAALRWFCAETNIDKAIQAITNAFGARRTKDGASVMTHYVYPSSSFVRVFVRGGENTFFVSDDGGAVMELEAAGIEITQNNLKKMAKASLSGTGLEFESGFIRSPFVSVETLPVYVALVARASQELTDALYKHARLQPEKKSSKKSPASK